MNQTQLTTVRPGYTAEEWARTCTNALKSYTQGYTEMSELYAPGWAKSFLALQPADRRAVTLLLATMAG